MGDISRNSTQKVNFIPCIKWVKRGVAKKNPENVQLSKAELLEIINQTKNKLSNNSETGEQSTSQPQQNNSDEFNLENYDEEGENTQSLGIDSLITLSPEDQEDENSDSESEKEDDVIKPDDNLIVVGHVEGDACILEVYVYNENEGSLYVHHDLLLPNYPLCFEWLDHEPGQKPGNYCAVGSMSPVIEIWDLDVMNYLEATYTLGQIGSRRKRIRRIGHTDAVLDLAWNKAFHHILASGSVDKTVLLWDLDEGEPHTTLKAFQDKVQSLKWHPNDPHALLAGGCDKTSKLFDCRSDSTNLSWPLDGEAERVIWDPVETDCFLVATSSGSIQSFDRRKGLLWSLEAHEQEVSGMVLSDECPGLLATSSGNGSVKVWDYSYNNIPRLIHTQNMNQGVIHCLEMCPDLPFVIASGGDKKTNNFSVLDLRTIDTVNHHFGSRPLRTGNGSSDCDVEMENLLINNS